MDDLLEKLKDAIRLGMKKTQIESALDLPKNSLSAVINGSKKMPTSWVDKLTEYLEQETPLEPFNGSHTAMVVKESGSLSLAPSKEKLEYLKKTMDGINKDFGTGSVMMLGDSTVNKDISSISTGSLGLDKILGVGGLPMGRIVEIYGRESSGKTTICLHIIAEAQKRGGLCAFIDAEHAFDSSYAQKLGVDVDNLLISQPDFGEQALEEADRLISSQAVSVVIIDSVAALVPKAELEGEMGDSKMGLHARLMSQACRKLVATVNKTGAICIFINQIREKIGVVYGSPITTTGGNALKFFSSVRIEVKRAAQLKDGDEVYGNKTSVTVVKNKVSPPFKTVEFDIIFGKGIDNLGEIVDLAVDGGIIQKSGSWYSYNGDKIGQGKDSVKGMLTDNPELFAEIKNKIKTI
jgi:recombination protein RecA